MVLLEYTRVWKAPSPYVPLHFRRVPGASEIRPDCKAGLVAYGHASSPAKQTLALCGRGYTQDSVMISSLVGTGEGGRERDAMFVFLTAKAARTLSLVHLMPSRTLLPHSRHTTRPSHTRCHAHYRLFGHMLCQTLRWSP